MSESSSNERGISPLDRAHDYRLSGDIESALRLSASILVATPDDTGAAALVSRILVDQGRPDLASNAASFLVNGFIRRGDLASSCVAAKIGIDAGLDGTILFRTIAQTFGKGSPYLDNVSLMPPPLPVEVDIAPFFQSVTGEVLLENAEKALKRFLDSAKPLSSDFRIPILPLFSALEPSILEQLLKSQQIRDVASEEYVIEQGQEGREAYVVARGVLNVIRENGSGSVLLAALGPGAIFGEMALVSRAPRGASVVALEPVQLLVLSRDSLEALAAKEPAIAHELSAFCHGRMVSNLMRHSALFAAIHPEKRKQLMTRFEAHTFEGGEVIVKQGQERAGLYLIASGGVQVISTDTEGDEVVLAELGPGDVVGEISLVLRRPATADVIALHPTVALELTRERFQEAIKEHPELLAELYELSTKREEETRSVVAQEALDVKDVILL